jgi:hypothetical protein
VTASGTTSEAVGSADRGADLRRARIADLRAIDLRADDRDLWADEAALWDRFTASWAGLDDAAWRLPGAAASDAGGPDWSLLDHVAHVAHWQDLAIDYIARARSTGRWPSDEDFDGGDFDAYNERSREPWAGLPPAEVRARIVEGHRRLLSDARRLPLEVIRSDDGWGWVFMALHGHTLDHLGVVEPWADRLRERQADQDPFDPGIAPTAGALDGGAAAADESAADAPADVTAFWAAEASTSALFDALVRPVPFELWTGEQLTPGWTLRDHVAHLGDWFEEGAEALDEHARTGRWREGPTEGFDAWNERALERSRTLEPVAVLARHDASLERLRGAARGMSPETLRSPDGWSWAYECLHGHVRSHLAMIGPWCVRVDWPPPLED